VLFGVIGALVALWCLVALVVGLLLQWPVIALGCLAGAVAAGTTTSAIIFRAIHRQNRR